MKVVEIKQELNDTSVERNMFDINRLSRHIISVMEIAKETNYTDYQYIFTLTSKVLDILDNIDYILGKGVLQNVKHNIRNRKITEALQEAVSSTDPMLFLEMVSNIRDTASNMIDTINMQSMTNEELKALYELAEICSYTIDRMFNIVIGID